MLRSRSRGLSLLETIIGTLIFSIVTVASLGVWVGYSRQNEKAQRDLLAMSLCQLNLEASLAVGYQGATSLPRTELKIDSDWTDIETGQTQKIEPSHTFEYERRVKKIEGGLKSVEVAVYYDAHGTERKVQLDALLYRTN